MIQMSHVLNEKLVAEGDYILFKLGLHNLLKKYGDPKITGSQSLGTMTWRDLDVYLINDEMNPSLFLELGKELVELINPRRMTYRNEFIGKTEGLPAGFYWGVYALMGLDAEWKIDIWALSTDQSKDHIKTLEYLRKELTQERKKIVLDIKTHYCNRPEYRKTVTSMDIYKAVIEDNVDSAKSFEKWLKNKN